MQAFADNPVTTTRGVDDAFNAQSIGSLNKFSGFPEILYCGEQFFLRQPKRSTRARWTTLSSRARGSPPLAWCGEGVLDLCRDVSPTWAQGVQTPQATSRYERVGVSHSSLLDTRPHPTVRAWCRACPPSEAWRASHSPCRPAGEYRHAVWRMHHNDGAVSPPCSLPPIAPRGRESSAYNQLSDNLTE